MSGIKVNLDGNIKYFPRDRIIAIAKQKGKLNQKQYEVESEGGFLYGNFFMDHFDPEWMNLYGQTEAIHTSMELTGKTK